MSFDQPHYNSTNIINFSVSLNEIISNIENSRPVFIKCIKPNENSFSNQVAINTLNSQVRHSGMVEYARIQKYNPSLKFDFIYLLNRFERLTASYKIQMNNMYAKDAVIKLLQASGIRNFRIGVSKVFMKHEDLDILETNQRMCPEMPKVLKIDTSNINLDQTQINPIKPDLNVLTPKKNPKPGNFDNEDQKDQDDLIQPKLEQEYWWDLARVTSRDFEIEQMNLKSRTEYLKILFKLFAYFVFFCIVLCSALVSKLSLFTMINAYKVTEQPDMYKIRWGIMLCSVISVPYLFTFFNCLQTVLFSSKDSSGSPKILVSLWVLFVELGHTFGIVLMIFKVLPNCENFTGLFIMSSVCLIPAMLKTIFSSRRGQTELKKMFIIAVDVIAVVLQFSMWIIFLVVKGFDSKVELDGGDFFVFNLIVSTTLISLGKINKKTSLFYILL